MRPLGILVLMAVLAALVAFFPCVASGDEEVPTDEPVVTIRLDQREQHVQVGPGQTGAVVYTGLVEADPLQILNKILMVNLSYNAGWEDRAWGAVGTLQVAISCDAPTAPFSCEVKVPLGTSHLTDGEITVRGSYRYASGSEEFNLTPDTSAILIDQYYRASLEPEKRSQQVDKNEYAEFEITLKNIGNGQDRFRLDIVADEGVTVEHDFPGGHPIAEGGSANFTVKVRSDEEGMKKIEVRIFGIDLYYTPSAMTTLEIQVHYNILEKAMADPIPGIAAVLIIAAVGVGIFFIIKRKRRTMGGGSSIITQRSGLNDRPTNAILVLALGNISVVTRCVPCEYL
jgi:hypothetical protein